MTKTFNYVVAVNNLKRKFFQQSAFRFFDKNLIAVSTLYVVHYIDFFMYCKHFLKLFYRLPISYTTVVAVRT